MAKKKARRSQGHPRSGGPIVRGQSPYRVPSRGRTPNPDGSGAFKDLFAEMDPRLREAFRSWHYANPGIFDEFRDLALRMRRHRERYSAWDIVGVLRWHRDITTRGDRYKISNDYIALLARLAVYHFPERLWGFFTLKRMKSRRKMVPRFDPATRPPRHGRQEE